MKISQQVLLWLLPIFSVAQNVDINILKSINLHDPTSTYWNITSSSAYFLPAGAVAGALAYGIIKKDKNIRHNAYELCISIGVSSLITEGIKYTVNRKRPAEKYPGEIFPAEQEQGHSLPSGHTSVAFASATTISLQYKKWYIVVPSYAWAATVGYSRMYRGVHYPSDVLTGALVGTGSAFLCHWLNKKIFPAGTNNKN